MLEASRRQDRRRGLERLGRSCAGHVAPERARPRRHAPRVYLAVALIAEHPRVHRMISELIDRVATATCTSRSTGRSRCPRRPPLTPTRRAATRSAGWSRRRDGQHQKILIVVRNYREWAEARSEHRLRSCPATAGMDARATRLAARAARGVSPRRKPRTRPRSPGRQGQRPRWLRRRGPVVERAPAPRPPSRALGRRRQKADRSRTRRA